MKANMDIRNELREAKITLWQLGQMMRCSEMTMIRRLRTELSEAEKNVIRKHIERIIEERTADEFSKVDFSILSELRCHNCGKFLGRCNGEAEIVCPRCKKLNRFAGVQAIS